jgi:SpoVK/Ycf46/Vps4 family AAA+-type ATPase
MNLMRGINLAKIANKMKGASGAESKAVCTEAGMFALRERRIHVTQVLPGPPSLVPSLHLRLYMCSYFFLVLSV